MNTKQISYEADVKPLFSASQRVCMLPKFDLWKYEDTKTWAGKIISRLTDGTMPDALTEGTGELNAEGSVRLAWMSVTMWANPSIVTQYPQLLATTTTIAMSPPQRYRW